MNKREEQAQKIIESDIEVYEIVESDLILNEQELNLLKIEVNDINREMIEFLTRS